MTNSNHIRQVNLIPAWELREWIDGDMEELVAKYKGLVSQESFSNIAWDAWKHVCDEEGDAYKHYPSMGNEVRF